MVFKQNFRNLFLACLALYTLRIRISETLHSHLTHSGNISKPTILLIFNFQATLKHFRDSVTVCAI